MLLNCKHIKLEWRRNSLGCDSTATQPATGKGLRFENKFKSAHVQWEKQSVPLKFDDVLKIPTLTSSTAIVIKFLKIFGNLENVMGSQCI